MNRKWPQEDKPTTEFNILQNVLSKEKRKIHHTGMNLEMGQRPHRKDLSSKKKKHLGKVLRILAQIQVICFAEKTAGTLGSRCEALGNSWIKPRENIRTLDGKGCSSGLMTYFCKGIQTSAPSQYLISTCKSKYKN